MVWDGDFKPEGMVKDEKGRWVKRVGSKGREKGTFMGWVIYRTPYEGRRGVPITGYRFDGDGLLRCGSCGGYMHLNPVGELYCGVEEGSGRCSVPLLSVRLEGLDMEKVTTLRGIGSEVKGIGEYRGQ